MKFTEFLDEGFDPTDHPVTNESPASQRKVVVSTVFYDAGEQPRDIQVEAQVSHDGTKYTTIQPTRVKFNGKLVKYSQFLQAIPTNHNQALHDPEEHLDVWSSWIE